MSPDTPGSPPLDAAAWLLRHPTVEICAGAFCLWISFSLILRMWFIHRNAPFLKKFLWSFILLIPLFGWFCYAALFHDPGYNKNQSPGEHSSYAQSGLGGDHV
jgi:hypothetical protein